MHALLSLPTKEQGQILVEVLVSMAVFVVIGGIVALGMMAGLRSIQSGGEGLIQLELAQEALDATESIARADWHAVYGVVGKGVTEYYPVLVQGSWWDLTDAGAQRTVSVDGALYERWVVIHNVSRDASGNIEEEFVQAREDPSVQLIVVFVESPEGSQVTLSKYVSRSRNTVTSQSDWSGGEGQATNPASGIGSDFNTSFFSQENIDYTVSGVLELASGSETYYLAIAHESTPYLTVYKRDGGTFQHLSGALDANPAGTGNGVAFSPDGTHLAIAHATSPYLTVYKRDGDAFQQLSGALDANPAGTGNGVAFSPDGTHLAIAHETSPYLTIYSRSGDTFQRLDNTPSDIPPRHGNGVAFSSDNTYLAIAHEFSPFATVYKRSGDTYTKLALDSDPNGVGFSASFSPDNEHLVIGHFVSPFATVYKRSGDTFEKLLGTPDVAPSNTGFGLSFSPDGTYLAVAHWDSPYLSIYERAGDVFTKIGNPSGLPTGNGQGASFSPLITE